MWEGKPGCWEITDNFRDGFEGIAMHFCSLLFKKVVSDGALRLRFFYLGVAVQPFGMIAGSAIMSYYFIPSVR